MCLYTSDSSTPTTYYYQMTTWPSGLRRVTRNHFSSGGVGSNPAVVVFCFVLLFLLLWYRQKNGSTQIRTGVLRTRISYAAPTPWNLSILLLFPSTYSPCGLFIFLFYSPMCSPLKKGHNRIRTNDHGNCSPMLYHWAMRPPIFPLCFLLFVFSFPVYLLKKRLPWVSNPRPYG